MKFKIDVSNVRPGKCDFNPEVGEPIGGLVDQFDTNHENPQFIIMMDLRVFLF